MQVKQETIDLLEDLHRPLEEHWSVNAKFGVLDAKNSDYMYKLHVTRLEDIYMNHKLEYPSPPAMLFRSPVSQLYGVNGLLVESEKKLKKKEGKWVNNFQKFSALAPDVVNDHNKPDKHEVIKNNKSSATLSAAAASSSPMHHRLGSSKSNRPRSPSPLLNHNVSITSYSNRPTSPSALLYGKQCDGVNHHSYQLKQQQQKNIESLLQMEDIIQYTLKNSRKKPNRRNRCDDIHISEEELIMRGMYRLNPSQEEIYRNFVTMIAGFDNFDKNKILEDVIRESEREDYLSFYGGTQLPREVSSFTAGPSVAFHSSV